MTSHHNMAADLTPCILLMALAVCGLVHADMLSDFCPRASCLSRCGVEGPSPGHCFCDAACELYQDCCQDYQALCRRPANTTASPPPPAPLEGHAKPCCTNVTYHRMGELLSSLMVVTECRRGFTDLGLRALCEAPTPSSVEKLDEQILVFSMENRMMYLNMHCALCNDVRDYRPISPAFVCDEPTTKNVSAHFQQQKDIVRFLYDECALVFDTNVLYERGRGYVGQRLECNVISSCQASSVTDTIRLDEIHSEDYGGSDADILDASGEGIGENIMFHPLDDYFPQSENTTTATAERKNDTISILELQEKCSSYSALVILISKVLNYKNVYCAVCNGIRDLDAVECLDMQTNMESDQLILPIFRMLLDFSPVRNLKIATKSSKLLFRDEPVCTKDEFLDVLHNRCSKLTCSLPHATDPGACRQSYLAPQPYIRNLYRNVHYVLVRMQDYFDLLFWEVVFANSQSLEVLSMHSGDVTRMLAMYGNVTCEPNSCVLLGLRHEYSGISEILQALREVEKRRLSYFYMQSSCSFTILSHVNDTALECSSGSLVWREDVEIHSTNFLQFEDSFTAYVESTAQEYPLEATVLRIDYKFEMNFEEKKFTKKVLFGVCETEIMSCPYVLYGDAFEIRNATLILPDIGNNATIPEGSFAIVSNTSVLICSSYLKVLRPVFSLHDYIQSYLGLVGLSASIACLALTIIGHCVCKSFKPLPKKIVINLCFSQIASQVLFLSSKTLVQYDFPCRIHACLQHYFWLASFLWMSVYSISLSLKFYTINDMDHSQEAKIFHVGACMVWGVPVFIVATCIALNFNTDSFSYGIDASPATFNKAVCWIHPQSALLLSFALPLGIILLMNGVCLAIVVSVMVKMNSVLQHMQDQAAAPPSTVHAAPRRSMVLISFKLSAIMGLAWGFGLLASIPHFGPVLWYGFILFTSLQGVFILCVFARKFYNHCCRGDARTLHTLHTGRMAA